MATDTVIEDRRAQIRDLLSGKGFMSLADLVQQTGFSESTVRRDLETLEEQGIARRAHGGAIFTREGPLNVMAFAKRESEMVPQKEAIAAEVARQIQPGSTVILDGGTTCYQVARALAGRRVSIITNSIPAALALGGEIATEVTLIGGYLYPRIGAALGPAAMQQLSHMHASLLVCSCAGVTEQGAFNSNEMIAEVQRQMMSIADRVILAVDNRKFGQSAVTKVCAFDDLDLIVTDSGIDMHTRGWLFAPGRKVALAEVRA